MRSFLTRAASALLIGATAWLPAHGQDELNQEDIAKIDAALPSEAPVAPKAPRKLLVFTRCRGYVHASIPYGAHAIAAMGEKTGAYEATVTDDANYFAPENINQFDGILMLSTTMNLFQDEPREQEYQEAFLSYVRSGKGLMGIHAATDCFYDWADYGEMMGGYFDGHPWSSSTTVTVKIDDPAHAIAVPFQGRKFDITDEIYQFREEPYSREKLRVILSLDTSPGSKTDMTRDGIKRTDGDFAVSWVHGYGDGRVYYCSLGHNTSVFQNPMILEYYLYGIQFALGDLEAETIPSATLSAEYLQQSKKSGDSMALDIIFEDLASFDYSEASALPRLVEEYVVRAQTDAALRGELALRFNTFLESDATLESKWMVAKCVNRIGGKDNIPTLAGLLADDGTNDLARYALERIADPGASRALLAALSKATGPAQAGIALSLGARREAAATAELAELTTSPDAGVASAACAALGAIATPEAARALNAVRTTAPGAKDALLACADTMAAEGANKAAADIYTAFIGGGEPAAIQRAAITGLANAAGEDALQILLDQAKADDAAIRLVAAGAASAMTSNDAVAALGEALPGLPNDAQIALIAGLGASGNTAAIAPLEAAAKSEHPDVRLAAIDGLGSVGDATVVPFVAGLAAGNQPEAGRAAEALASLHGEAVDRALIGLINDGDPAMSAPAIAAVKERHSQGAIDALMNATSAESAKAREAAYAGLGELAGTGVIQPIVDELAAMAEENVRTAAALAVVDIAKRNGAEMDAVVAVSEAAQSYEPSGPLWTAYCRILSGVSTAEALEMARMGLDHAKSTGDPDLVDATVRCLSNWESPAAIATLADLADTLEDDTLQIIAFRGALRLAAIPQPRPESETLALHEQLLALAPTDDEKKSAIAALAKVRDPRVYDVVKPYLESETFKSDAEFVVNTLDKVKPVASASHNSGEAHTALDGDLNSRWGTGESMKTGMWFEVDLGWEREVNSITLDCTGSDRDYPRGYEVYLYTEPGNMGQPAASGNGDGPVLKVDVPDTVCRFIRIVHTTPVDSPWWSIHELTIE